MRRLFVVHLRERVDFSREHNRWVLSRGAAHHREHFKTVLCGYLPRSVALGKTEFLVLVVTPTLTLSWFSLITRMIICDLLGLWGVINGLFLRLVSSLYACVSLGCGCARSGPQLMGGSLSHGLIYELKATLRTTFSKNNHHGCRQERFAELCRLMHRSHDTSAQLLIIVSEHSVLVFTSSRGTQIICLDD